MAIQYLDEERNEINAPVGRMEWLQADTLRPWRHQRDLSKATTLKIARDFDPDMLGTLTVTRRGGINYLLDGQHRLAAIRDVLGWADQNVPCIVYEGLDDQQEAKLFNGQAPGNRRQLSKLHALYVAYQAGDLEAIRLNGTVERSGLVIGWLKGGTTHETVVAVGALQDVARTLGHYRLGTILDLLREGLGPQGRAYSGDLIKGMGAFLVRYEDTYNRDELIERLRRAGLDAVTRQASTIKAALGAGSAAAYGRALHQLYNKSRPEGSAKRLTEWQDNVVDPEIRATAIEVMTRMARRDYETGIRKPAGRRPKAQPAAE